MKRDEKVVREFLKLLERFELVDVSAKLMGPLTLMVTVLISPEETSFMGIALDIDRRVISSRNGYSAPVLPSLSPITMKR